MQHGGATVQIPLKMRVDVARGNAAFLSLGVDTITMGVGEACNKNYDEF